MITMLSKLQLQSFESFCQVFDIGLHHRTNLGAVTTLFLVSLKVSSFTDNFFFADFFLSTGSSTSESDNDSSDTLSTSASELSLELSSSESSMLLFFL